MVSLTALRSYCRAFSWTCPPDPSSRYLRGEDAFGFGIFAPFVPVLAKTFGMTARNIAGLVAQRR